MAENLETILELPMGNLDVGTESRRLYWKGQPIVTEEKIKLSKLVNISIIIGAISTAFYAIVTFLTYLKM